MPYTLALHAGLSKEPGVADNPHLHLVFSEPRNWRERARRAMRRRRSVFC